ncbi:MAG: 50S ribosomal protein L23 [Chloroflexota bacterium]|nr:50S ribosomal protein L23 [Chloroflexota bacterium]
MNPYEIIIQPIDTEKTRFQASEQGKYAFEVHPGANKIEIKQAVEMIFGVEVEKVNTLIMPAKMGWRSYRGPWKKAIVTVAEGERIDVFEGAA